MSTETNVKNENKPTESNDWEQEDEVDEWGSWSDEENDEKESTSKTDKEASAEVPDTESSPVGISIWKPWGIIEKVIGVPDPEELAHINAKIEASTVTEEKVENVNTNKKNMSESYGLNFITAMGSKVLNTGLDTLEGIGKKTMNILQENDPHLMNKRKMLGLESDRPNLSALLKEAKADADQLEDTMKALNIEKTKQSLRFDLLFENSCGLVHLEALEILSNESKIRLHTLLSGVSGQALAELQETVNEVKELLELDGLEAGETDGSYNAEELSSKLLKAIEDADFQIKFDDIVSAWDIAQKWLETSDTAEVDEIYARGITALAESCALSVNKLHKIGELLLVREHHSTANEIDSCCQLCGEFMKHLNGLTQRFASELGKRKDNEEAQVHIAAIFSDLQLAVQQIEKSFKFFLPILQIGAV